MRRGASSSSEEHFTGNVLGCFRVALRFCCKQRFREHLGPGICFFHRGTPTYSSNVNFGRGVELAPRAKSLRKMQVHHNHRRRILSYYHAVSVTQSCKVKTWCALLPARRTTAGAHHLQFPGALLLEALYNSPDKYAMRDRSYA